MAKHGASATVRPIYVLHGDDAFMRDAHRREIVAHVIKDADPQLAVTTFDPDAELADVLDELRTAPFLTERRVVILRDADAFVTKHRKALEEYLAAPSGSASLMLIVSSWRRDTRLAKLADGFGQCFDCEAAGRKGLGAWIGEAAGRRGKKIARDAAELLEHWVGTDKAALDAEIEKLSIYVGDRSQISIEDVSVLVAATAGPGAFALTNAITAGDAATAVEALGGMLTTRGDEFKTLGMIAWHLRRALKAQRQMESSGRFDLRLPYDQRGPFLAMLRRRPREKLHADFRKLLRADLNMKSGLGATAVLQELVVGLCD